MTMIDRERTYSEKHPAPGKRHFLDRIRLFCETAVLPLQLLEGDRDVFRGALESLQEQELLHGGIGGTCVNRPGLSQVSEIRKLGV